MAYTNTMFGQDGQALVSYCDGAINTDTKIGTQGKGNIHAATYIDEATASRYKNLRAVGMNVGLASVLNIETLTVWARKTIDGENLTEATCNAKDLKKGWNYIAMPKSEVISGGFYIGCTIKQKGLCYAFSAVGAQREGGFSVNLDGTWEDKSADGNGNLSQGVYIEAENLVGYDLSLEKVIAPKRMCNLKASKIVATVKNVGSRTVNGYTITCKSDGHEGDDYHFANVLIPGASSTDTISYTTPFTEKTKNVELNIAISGIDDGEDNLSDNNSQKVVYDVDKYDFVKRVLVEEFTTERCVNCPSAAALMSQTLALDEFKDRAMALCHHAGYHTDWLTLDIDESYLWFYNAGSNVFAPAFMFNRLDIMNSKTPVMSNPSSLSYFSAILSGLLASEPNVAFNTVAKFDEASGMLKVHVDGERDKEFGNTQNRITVFLSENDVPAKSQSGAGEGYMQEHVLRAHSSTWADVIDWNGDGFSYDCYLDFSNVMDKNNCEVIVIVHDYDSSTPSNCAIENAAKTSNIDWGTSGINDNKCESLEIQRSCYYNISGKVVTPEYKGVVIRKDVYKDGSVRTVKTVR